MRIVYLNPVGVIGGAERALLSVLASVRQADPAAELHLIACTDGPLLQQAEKLGVRSVLLRMPECMARAGDSQHRHSGWLGKSWGFLRQAGSAGPATWRFARLLRQTFRNLQPDLVHTNGIKSHLLARLAGTDKAPVIWHVQDFYGERPFVGRLLRWARKGVFGAVAISEAVARDVQGLLPDLPTRVIFNAVDTGHFAPGPADPSRLDRLAGLPPANGETVRVGLVAAYARWKGQDVFLRAAAQACGCLPPHRVRFYVIGGPIYRTQGSQFSTAELRSTAQSLGVQDQVGFIDFQHDPADVYRDLDVVVHASTRPEPFGLTIIEGMACARPVIVARAGGAAELFTHDHDAVGVAPGDAAALASAITDLANSPERRRHLANNARQTVLSKFNQRDLGPQVLDAYSAWLRAPAPGRVP